MNLRNHDFRSDYRNCETQETFLNSLKSLLDCGLLCDYNDKKVCENSNKIYWYCVNPPKKSSSKWLKNDTFCMNTIEHLDSIIQSLKDIYRKYCQFMVICKEALYISFLKDSDIETITEIIEPCLYREYRFVKEKIEDFESLKSMIDEIKDISSINGEKTKEIRNLIFKNKNKYIN